MTEPSNSISFSVTENGGELIDPNITKIENIDTQLDEISEIIKDRMKMTDELIGELKQLAKAAQTPDYYEAYSKVIAAGAKEIRELSLIKKMKIDLLTASASGGQDSQISQVNSNNNTIVATSTDVIERIKRVIDGTTE